jgi:hypothetical protein
LTSRTDVMRSARRHAPGPLNLESAVHFSEEPPHSLGKNYSSKNTTAPSTAVRSENLQSGHLLQSSSPLIRRSMAMQRPGAVDVRSSRMQQQSPIVKSSRLHQTLSEVGVSPQQMSILQQAHFDSVAAAPTPGRAKVAGILRPKEYVPMQKLKQILSKFGSNEQPPTPAQPKAEIVSPMSMIRRKARKHQEVARGRRGELGEAHVAIYKQRGASREGAFLGGSTSIEGLNDSMRAEKIGVLDVGSGEEGERGARETRWCKLCDGKLVMHDVVYEDLIDPLDQVDVALLERVWKREAGAGGGIAAQGGATEGPEFGVEVSAGGGDGFEGRRVLYFRCVSWEDRDAWIESIMKEAMRLNAPAAAAAAAQLSSKRFPSSSPRYFGGDVASASSSPLTSSRRGKGGKQYLENDLGDELERTRMAREEAELTIERTRSDIEAGRRKGLMFMGLPSGETGAQIVAAFGRFGELRQVSYLALPGARSLISGGVGKF